MSRGPLLFFFLGLLISPTLAQDLDPDLTARVPFTVIEQGYGGEAKLGDTLVLDYTLRLGDEKGEVLDSTEGKSPMVFELGSERFILGFTLGLRDAKRGEIRSFTVPADLGYGDQQVGPIPANSPLFFEVRVVRIIEPGQEEEELSEIFGRDGSGSRRHANQLDLPAVQEYLIRDFFTRPWRFDDASQRIWRQNALLTLVLGCMLFVAFLNARRRKQ